jgi:hydrogenase maturation factor
MVRYTGSCHCKTVTYEIVLPNGEFQEQPEYDFCVDCRRVAGSLMVSPPVRLVLIADWLVVHPGFAIEMAHRGRQAHVVQILRERRETILFGLWVPIYI